MRIVHAFIWPAMHATLDPSPLGPSEGGLDEQSWICEGDHSPREVPLGDHLPEQLRAALEACLTPG